MGSIRRTRADARGEESEGSVAHVPSELDVKAIRANLHLSQQAFAKRFGFRTAAVRDCDQHRRQPERAAKMVLLVIDRAAEVVNAALAEIAGP